MTAILNPVKVATNANLASFTVGVPSSIDGVNIYANDRVLVKSQTDTTQNGIYVYTVTGTLERASDFALLAEILPSSIVFVQEGDLFADTGWVISTAPPIAGNAPLIVGTNQFNFSRFSINPNLAVGESILSAITLRREKGYPLTNDELDNNFKYLALSLAQKVDTEDYNGQTISDLINTISYVDANLNANRLHGYYPSDSALDPNYTGLKTIAVREADGKLNATTFVGNLDGSASRLNNQLASFYTNASNISSGTLAIARGGTGSNTAIGALSSLGAVAKSGDTMTGKLSLRKSTTTAASLNLDPTGAEPAASSVSGDIWATNNTIRYRLGTGEIKTVAFLQSPVFTTPSLSANPGQTSNSTAIASTAFTQTVVGNAKTELQNSIALKANIASPTLTGTPIAPDIGLQTSSQIATRTYTENYINNSLDSYYNKPTIDSKLLAITGTSTRTIKQVDDDVQEALQQTGVPVGTVMYYAANKIPAGWLKCAGQYVKKSQYPVLYDAIGGTYGSTPLPGGDVSFRLPDLRGEFIRGFDDGRGVDVNRVFGSSQLDEFRSHSHQIWGGDGGNYSSQKLAPYLTRDDAERPVVDPGSLRQSGGTETRPRNVALTACIKAFGTIDDEVSLDIQQIYSVLDDKVAKSGSTMTGYLTLAGNPTNGLHAATKQYVDSSISTISLTPGPQGPIGPTGAQGPQGLRGLPGASYTFTYGNTQYTNWFTNIVGSWNNTYNWFDVYPPSGKSMSQLMAFIPSIAVIHYAGKVDYNDSIRCTWSNLGDRIRVYVQNTEQRATPAANWLAIWRD